MKSEDKQKVMAKVRNKKVEKPPRRPKAKHPTRLRS